MKTAPALTKKKKFFIAKCLRDLLELRAFYGRESGCLDLSDLEDKYGRDTVETCLINGWIKRQNKICPNAPGAAYPCWITQNGIQMAQRFQA